ncbi:MAG: hypothetical protein Q9217_005643 [Psora testacea]
MDSINGYSSGTERGTRRRKLAGYLNELRQSYQQQYGLGGRDGVADQDEGSVPGAFPDVSVVRNGDEEMLLFPSYARQHKPSNGRARERPGAAEGLRSTQASRDEEYWKKEWEQYEDDNAIVDVDIRGWIYSPHKGQMTRKNRLLVGIARHLSGIPAPASSRASSPSSPHHARVEARAARHEEELVEKEAESIERRGLGEADVAHRGGYSEAPSGRNDRASPYSPPDQSRDPSPVQRASRGGPMPRPVSNISSGSVHNDPSVESRDKRGSWNHPSEMSSEELSVANAHLMIRLKPFLTTPLVSTPLTVFFYNDNASRSRTIMTNEAGHFSLRAALDFIPTHVRVLASDKLSATEEVRITQPRGVSMISDIDDTIKHSAIGSGAKEIFRNAFIRNLRDLTIEGVKDWYSTMANLGVELHYVSNSPWQLYPVLTSFFAEAGLPKGSFHLKQYTGMLQGIFEPVAERKKGTLDKIISDFPERRFILVGDSGEADLELYTDIMLANPGRIIGVFIRDVTTTKPRGFFDSGSRSRDSRSPFRGRKRVSDSVSPKPSSAALNDKPPALPPRTSTRSSSSLTTEAESTGPIMGTLIDFNEDPPRQEIHRSRTESEAAEPDRKASTVTIKSLPPVRPSKPLTLRPVLNKAKSSSTSPVVAPNRKPVPPLPPKPRKYSLSTSDAPNAPNERSPLSQIQTSSPPGSRATSLERQSYRAAVKNKVASAYNALPSWYNPASLPSQSQPPTSDGGKQPSSSQPPPVPPRKNLSSYPAAAAHYATNRLSGGWSGSDGSSDGATNGASNGGDGDDPVLSKKEELWMRRWARARNVFEEKGVLLRSWRIGQDVADECVRLVERALREDERMGFEAKHGKGD